MMNRLLSLGVLSLMVWCAGIAAADTPVPDVAALVSRFGGPHWYTVHLMGRRAGYVRWQAHADDTPAGPRLRIEEYSKIYFRIEAGPQEMDSRQVVYYDARLRPHSIRLWQNLMGRLSETTVDVDRTELHVTISQPDGVHERRLAVPDDFGSELSIMLAAASGQVGPGWETAFSAFDPYSGHFDRYLVSFSRWEETNEGRLAVLQTRLEQLGLAVESRLDSDGMLIRQGLSELMGMEMIRSTEQEALAEIVGPALGSGIAVGMAPTDPHKADQVSLLANAAGGAVTELVPTTSRQQVLTQSDGSALIVTTPEQAPAEALQLPITDPELAVYLEPNELTQSDSDAIKRLAEGIIGQERDAWRCAQLLLRWVHQNLRKLSSEPRPLSALEILQAGEGDCSEHAVLLAALAKSAGIPVRIVVGLVYVNGSYGYHEWNELFVGRWVQMDASWGRETVGAGHVELAKSASDRDAMLTSHLAIGRTIGTLFLKFDHSRNAE